MARTLEVFQLPPDSGGDRLGGRAAVAIDVLRASTTIVAALSSGAAGVRTFLTLSEARRHAADSGALAGGERGGLPIDGFDLGNSPLEYVPSRVAGREIAFTTTNGTRAIQACISADHVLIGGFVNAAAIASVLRHLGLPVALVCAGTDRVPTLEDTLCAGLVCERITGDSRVPEKESRRDWQLGTGARAAREMWRTAARRINGGETLADMLRRSRGGQNLIELERDDDVAFAALLDRFNTVPRLDRQRNLIVPWSPAGEQDFSGRP